MFFFLFKKKREQKFSACLGGAKMYKRKGHRHCRALEYRTQFPVGILLFFGTLAMLAVNESAEMKYVFLAAFGLSVLGKAIVRKYMHEHVK